MKIVHITNCLRGGGVQNFLLSLLPEQVKQGHTVSLIVIEKYDYEYCERLEQIFINHGVQVCRLDKERHNKKSLIKTIYACRGLVNRLNPDVINTHCALAHLYGSVSVVCRSIKQVVTIHNAPEHWDIPTKLFCHKRPFIFCSRAAYEQRLQNSKCMCAIDNGISREIVHSENVVDLKAELGLKPSDKVIVLVGSLRPQKNYLFLKEIVDVAGDESMHFCICGGNYGTGYIDMAEFKDYSNIHCLGLRSDVSAIENGADLFLSCSSFEGLPIAVLEAYFNGIPCVLSPIEQHKNIADVYKVYIPDEFTAPSFVNTVKYALANNEDHDIIYRKRKEQLEQYSIYTTCKKYIDFYQRIIDDK